MEKEILRPYEALYPIPAVLVSSKYKDKENIITIAWIGTVCSNPPMVSISIRPNRFSHKIIAKSREFVVNIPKKDMLDEINYCGMVSGEDKDKWERCKFRKLECKNINVSMIDKCPVNIECKVVDIINLGSHDLFLGEILAVHKDKNIKNLDPLTFLQGEYWGLGKKVGSL